MSAAHEESYPSRDDLEAVIEMALKVNEACGSMCCEHHRSEFLRELFNDADVVWCVWQDAEEADAFQCVIVKGEGRTGHLDATAFLVPDHETADSLRSKLGDGATIHQASGTAH